MSMKAYTWIDGQRIATGGYDEATSPAGWRAPEAANPEPTRVNLETLRRDLCDHCCAAEESGKDKLALDLSLAIDVIDEAIGRLAPEAERGFGA